MRPGPAQVESLHWRTVSRPTEHGAHREELVERGLAVEDVSPRESELVLEIRRRDDLPPFDERGQTGGVPFERCDHEIAQLLPRAIPATVSAEAVRREL